MNEPKTRGYMLLLVFAAGMSPKTAIALGYPRSTVYRWYHNYRANIKLLRADIARRVSCLSQSRKKD